jgi:hypothetical protein
MNTDKVKLKLDNHEVQALRACMAYWGEHQDFYRAAEMPVELELMRELAFDVRCDLTRTSPGIKRRLKRSMALALYRMLMNTPLAIEHDVFRNSIARGLDLLLKPTNQTEI